MKEWRLKRTRQCDKCPWRADVDPRTIPRGYSETKHRLLASTIAMPGSLQHFLANEPLHVMACHEMHEAHCVGWLMHQVSKGNNITLRMLMMGCTNAKDIALVGEQHASFEDTLPRQEDS